MRHPCPRGESALTLPCGWSRSLLFFFLWLGRRFLLFRLRLTLRSCLGYLLRSPFLIEHRTLRVVWLSSRQLRIPSGQPRGGHRILGTEQLVRLRHSVKL